MCIQKYGKYFQGRQHRLEAFEKMPSEAGDLFINKHPLLWYKFKEFKDITEVRVLKTKLN